jgi:hypothetical protein
MNIFEGGLFEDERKRRRPAGYIPLFDDALLADEPVAEEAVTPEERNSVLAEIGAVTGGTLSRVGDALAMPGDYARGLLAGRTGERVTGRELNRMAGLAGPEDNWLNFAGGLATELITDPLALLSGPAKALTPAGKAAAKLAGTTGNLLDTAPTAMTRKAISEGWLAKPPPGTTQVTPSLPMVAERTRKTLEDTGRTISTFDPATVGRPLYGTRTARRAGTLDDLIKYADDPDAAEASARQLLGDAQLAQIRNQPLAKSFGIGMPLGDPLIVGDFLGKGFGDKYADVLDTIGQATRWSMLGRGLAAGFDARVGGKIDAEEQITNIANWQARKVGGGAETADHTLRLSRLRSAHPDVFSQEGNERLGRYLEGAAVRTPEDVQYVNSRPALKEYADWWASKRDTSLGARRELGLNGEPLTDQYGIDYLPRRADPALEMEARTDRKIGSALSYMTTDALRRTDAMSVPGGRSTIMELSQDANVSGPKRLMKPDEEAAVYIQDRLNALVTGDQPEVTLSKARKIARILNALPEQATKKMPLFGQHPTEMIGSYVRNTGESLGTGTTLLDSLATFAVDRPYNLVDTSARGTHVSLPNALRSLGLKTYDDATDQVFDALPGGGLRDITPQVGAAQQMRERLAKLLGKDPDEINLNQFSIPEEHVRRLTRAKDLYSTGEASGALMKYLDHYTQAWRGSILAWPSRAVRDLYSGAISNWLEGALDWDSVRAAKALVMEGPDSQKFRSTLASIPRYANDDGLAQFYADLSSTGLVSGGSASDLSASVAGQRATDNLVGSDPISMASIGRELGKGWNSQDFFSWRSKLTPLVEQTNPLLRAGDRMNSLTDGVNRLTGYLSLLKQGYDPMAAAAAMKRAHVDYASLSGMEKSLLKAVFPWYSYQSRIFREVLRQLAERPGGRYGQLIHATEALQDEGEDTYVPSGLRSQFAFPIPEMFGGVPAPGTQTYLTDIDAPGFDQINMVETPGTVGGMLSGTARQIAMQLHPAYRMGAEAAFGKDLFTNRPLSEATSSLDAIARAVSGNPYADVPSIIEKPVEALPFVGRPLYVARSLLDDRGGQPLQHRLGKTALNAVSGVKLRDVAQQDALADAVRQIEESIDPYTREFQQTYIPEHLQPGVPQWALQRMAVSRALGRERREARKKTASKGKKSKKRKSDTSAVSLFE